MIRLYVDASLRGQPGHLRAGFGWLTKDGDTTTHRGSYLISTTSRSSSLAELQAVEYGLERAAEHHPESELAVYSDALGVIDVLSYLSKRQKVEQLAHVRELETCFASVTYIWIERSKNHEAHQLASWAFRTPRPGREEPLQEPPGPRFLQAPLTFKPFAGAPAWWKRLVALNANHGKPRTGRPPR